MRNKILLVLGLVFTTVLAPAQNTSVTNNNTIVINGDVYYFRPSTTPSSPQPRAGGSNWIGDGEWWGADAARAWASIVDWVVLHCYKKEQMNNNGYWIEDSDVRTNSFDDVYINRITVKRSGNSRRAEVKIYYWLVRKGKKMEEGTPAFQTWYVEF
jgi:hypothetical protein